MVLKRTTKEFCFRIFVYLIMLPYCVYILFSEKDYLLYTGYTSDLKKRISKHNAGEVLSTAPRRPLKLIFCEYYLHKEDAEKREKYFKTTMGKKAVKLMLRSTLEKIGYKGSLKEIAITEDIVES
jgi:putative endonuclease